MLEKRIEYQHTVLADGQVEVRRDEQIWENGVFLSHAYHRHVIHPGQDLSQEDIRGKIIAMAIYTPEFVTAWKTSEEKQHPRTP